MPPRYKFYLSLKPITVITPGICTKRAISLYAEPGVERIDIMDIGVRISTQNIVIEGQLIIISLILHVNNHYTKQSTLALFIPWSGIPTVMRHRGIWGDGGQNDLLYFIYSGKVSFVYVLTYESSLWEI